MLSEAEQALGREFSGESHAVNGACSVGLGGILVRRHGDSAHLREAEIAELLIRVEHVVEQFDISFLF